MRKLKEIWSRFMHADCIQANIDAYNKQRKIYAHDIGMLQDKVSDLQNENLRLHKEILFTQEGYEKVLKKESHDSYD